MVGAVDGEMLDVFGGLLFEIFDEVNVAVSLLEELSRDLLHPVRDGGREHEGLHVLGPG